MIRSSRRSLLALAAVALCAAWGPATDSNAYAAKPVAAAPTTDVLLALEQQATAAYIKGDGNFFEHYLSDKPVIRQGARRVRKADFVKMINGVKCSVKDGWTFTRPQLLQIDHDTYVLSYVENIQGSCTVAGKTEQIPSPVRVASVWVRIGGSWKVAFHGDNQIVDPAAPTATDKVEASGKPGKVAADVNTAAARTPVAPAADSTTQALMKVENSLWHAWMTKDIQALEGLTARDIAFVDIFGSYSANKAAAIKVWTGPACKVSSFSLSNGASTIVSPRVAILTLTGTVDGSCGDKDISGQKIHGNTVYVKDGNAWRWVFGFNSPG